MKYLAIFHPKLLFIFLNCLPDSDDPVLRTVKSCARGRLYHLLIIGIPWKTFSIPSILSVLIPPQSPIPAGAQRGALLTASLTIFVPRSVMKGDPSFVSGAAHFSQPLFS